MNIVIMNESIEPFFTPTGRGTSIYENTGTNQSRQEN